MMYHTVVEFSVHKRGGYKNKMKTERGVKMFKKIDSIETYSKFKKIVKDGIIEEFPDADEIIITYIFCFGE